MTSFLLVTREPPPPAGGSRNPGVWVGVGPTPPSPGLNQKPAPQPVVGRTGASIALSSPPPSLPSLPMPWVPQGNGPPPKQTSKRHFEPQFPQTFQKPQIPSIYLEAESWFPSKSLNYFFPRFFLGSPGRVLFFPPTCLRILIFFFGEEGSHITPGEVHRPWVVRCCFPHLGLNACSPLKTTRTYNDPYANCFLSRHGFNSGFLQG